MFNKTDFIVRHGAKIIAVRKTWTKAQDSAQAYIREMAMFGTIYKLTKTNIRRDAQDDPTYGEFCYAGAAKGAILVLTINRGS